MGPHQDAIIRCRSRSLKGCVAQIFASILGSALWAIRETWMIPVVNSTSCLLALVGLYGVLTLNVQLISVHGVVTCGAYSACFVYGILELIFAPAAPSAGESPVLPDGVVLLLFCFPYLVDFIAGGLSLRLATALNYFAKAELAVEGLPSDEQVRRNWDMEDSSLLLCCVCLEAQRNTLLSPCGHKAFCFRCANSLLRRSGQCPICRKSIRDVVVVYE